MRGCCAGILVAAVLTGATGFLAVRAMAAPDLGAPPGGADDGSTQEAVAATMALRTGSGLITGNHVVVTLSERDLTVIARARNPDPFRFHGPEARVRDGRLALSARNSVGPLPVTTVAYVVLSLSHPGTANQRLTGQVADLQVGTLPIPQWARAGYDARAARAFDLEPLLSSHPLLQAARANLDCVSVAADGLRLGFHRPNAPADPAGCS